MPGVVHMGRKFGFIILLTLCLAMGGCAIAWRNLTNDDDKNKEDNGTYTVDCSLGTSDIGYCLEKGIDVCGENGYDIISVDYYDDYDYDTWDFELFEIPGVIRQMVIRCRKQPKVEVVPPPWEK